MDQKLEDTRRALLLALGFISQQSTHKAYQSAAQYGAATLLVQHFGSPEAVEEAGIARQLEYLWQGCDQPREARERFATAWLEANAKKLGLTGLSFSINDMDSIVAEVAFVAMTNRALVGLDPALA